MGNLTPEESTVDPAESLMAGSFSSRSVRVPVQAWSAPQWTVSPPTAGISDEATRPIRGAGDGQAAPEGGARYELLKMIGAGGMGEVWEARQAVLDRIVAVKRIRFDEGDEAVRGDMHRDFRHEALVSARLEHPNIAPVHDLGSDEKGDPLLAMKRVRGEPWNRLIQRDFASSDPADFLGRHIPVLIAVAQAVAYAHSEGFVHRDIKPSQVMVDAFGEILLMDWGLAIYCGEGSREGRSPSPAIATLESASSPAGTPALMAPEQTEPNADHVGPWTDVFLLGGTLYCLLTGMYPYSGAARESVMQLAAECNIQPPSVRAPDRAHPPELEALAMRCLSRDPLGRPASAAEVLAGLQDFLTGAGRRRQSLEMSAAAERQLAEGGNGYRDFGEIVAALGNARALWPGNPAVAPLRESALEQLGLLAIAQGDLALARVQAERLAPGPPRAAMLARVESEERDQARRARQRTHALRAAAAAILLLAVGGFTAAAVVSEQRDRALRERNIASAARANSQAVVDFMIGDLRQQVGRVDPTLRSLDTLAAEALKYYARQPVELLSAAQRGTVYSGYAEVAGLLRQQGKPAEAAEAARKGLAALRADGAFAKEPLGRPVEQRLLLEAFEALQEVERLDDMAGDLHRLYGELRQAYNPAAPNLEHAAAFSAILRLVPDLKDSRAIAAAFDADVNAVAEQYATDRPPADRREAAVWWSAASAMMGPKRSVTLGSMQRMSGWLATMPPEWIEDADFRANVMGCCERLRTNLFGRGYYPDLLAMLASADRIFAPYAAEHPLDLAVRTLLVQNNSDWAAALLVNGEVFESGKRLALAERDAKFLLEREPEHAYRRQTYLYVLMYRANTLGMVQDLEGQMEVCRAALDALPPISKEASSDEIGLQIPPRTILMRPLMALGRWEEALGHLRDATRVGKEYLAMHPEEPTGTNWLVALAQCMAAEILVARLDLQAVRQELDGAYDVLAPGRAANSQWMRDYGRAQMAEAFCDRMGGDFDSAADRLACAAAFTEDALARTPSLVDLRVMLASTAAADAELRMAAGDPEGAYAQAIRAGDLMGAVVEQSPSRVDIALGYAGVLAKVADAEFATGRFAAARASAASCGALFEGLAFLEHTWRHAVPSSELELVQARLLKREGDEAAARELLERALARLDPWIARGLRHGLLLRLRLLRELGRDAEYRQTEAELKSLGVATDRL